MSRRQRKVNRAATTPALLETQAAGGGWDTSIRTLPATRGEPTRQSEVRGQRYSQDLPWLLSLSPENGSNARSRWGRGFILVSHRLTGTIHGSSVPMGEAFLWPPQRKECKREELGPQPREQVGLEIKEQWQVSAPSNTVVSKCRPGASYVLGPLGVLPALKKLTGPLGDTQ